VAFLLAGLLPPTNVARRVRELQESLYRLWGLLSPLALPPLIPLAFFDPGADGAGVGAGDAGGAAGAAGARVGGAAGAGDPGAGRPATGAAGAGAAAGSPEHAPGTHRPDPAVRVARRLEEELRRVFRGQSAPRAPRFRNAGFTVAGEPASGPLAGVAGAAAAALFWEVAAEPDRGAARAVLAVLADLVRARVEAVAGWLPLLLYPFPLHPGFFLALQEPGLDLREVAAALPAPEPLSFPATALTVLRVRRLPLEPFPGDAAAAAEEAAAPPPGTAGAFEQPHWWRALLWEELLNVPLKKPPREAAQQTD
jgi:hypothetical protein